MKKRIKRKIYSHELGIDLSSKKESEYFKWFLACLLFGKPIQQEAAKQTFFEFEKEGLVSADAIIKAGWESLVKVLDKGRYTRYDFSTATKLLEVCKKLQSEYGTLTNLFQKAGSRKELVSFLEDFKGVGPVTVRIFLRDIEPVL